jgi:hypothetical protein
MKIRIVVLVVAVTACAEKAVVAPAAEPARPAPRAEPASSGERAAPPARPSTEDFRAATKSIVQQYAFEAFPQWAATHPDRMCPDKLADLIEFINNGDGNDAWGRPLKMMCGAILPPGAKGIAVMSNGEDGKEGTKDDIKSWE